MEAIWKNKYAAIGFSAFSDAMNYVTNTPSDQITAAGFGASLGFGAISGFIGNNAADYIGKIGGYMVKYGPQPPWQSLGDLGIRPFFAQLSDFRELLITKAWANPGWSTRGFALEEISSYGRYSDYTWMNAAGELGGPLDFIKDGLGIQLKTSAATTWSGVRSNAVGGLNQLVNAINSGQCTTGRLDVMMPDNLSGNFAEWQQRIYDDLINNNNYPEFSGLDAIIGSFIE